MSGKKRANKKPSGRPLAKGSMKVERFSSRKKLEVRDDLKPPKGDNDKK